MFLLVTLYVVNRQRRLALQQSTHLLEMRVRHRTIDLEKEIDVRRAAEDSLRNTQEELIHTAKMAALGEISASISHELNQPLTAIRTYAESANRMLAKGAQADVSGNLEAIGSLTNRMSNIMSQLRGFSRKSKGERSRLSLALAVKQSLAIFSNEITQNNITVDADLPPEISIVTDPVLFDQVMVNLISNAIHAMEGVDDRRLKIECAIGSDAVSVSVIDSGVGIAREVIDNIFDPFFTTKEVGLGLGMGLSISYRIMANLGGRIDVKNLSPCGAQFTIELPLVNG